MWQVIDYICDAIALCLDAAVSHAKIIAWNSFFRF